MAILQTLRTAVPAGRNCNRRTSSISRQRREENFVLFVTFSLEMTSFALNLAIFSHKKGLNGKVRGRKFLRGATPPPPNDAHVNNYAWHACQASKIHVRHFFIHVRPMPHMPYPKWRPCFWVEKALSKIESIDQSRDGDILSLSFNLFASVVE